MTENTTLKPKRSFTPKYRWRIHKDRKDKRVGAISPVPTCRYFKHWSEKYEKAFRGGD